MHAENSCRDHRLTVAGPDACPRRGQHGGGPEQLTCAELNRLGFQDFAGITMWMSGYYNASIRNTTIDLDRFAQAAKIVKDHCVTTPRATVMSAAEKALGIKMPRGR
jgi:hypothetical protein